jgi:TolB-like protein/Flp pilus assembly protein TadD
MPTLMTELKRRNVLRVAAAYALVAWILIESGSVLLPTFGAPEWFFKVYVIMVFAGFVISLVFAWIFEITPDGVRLEKDVDRKTYRPPERTGGIKFMLIGLLVVALAVSITLNFMGLHDDVPLSSVAVLPFENRSADPENGYFADGIQDDLLHRLAKIDSLHVISRTSVNEYRNTTKHVSLIGEELGVAAVVQGAVQRSGDDVRISVSLIDAKKDKPIWAQTYDENASLLSVFELQTVISSQITSALQAVLTPEERERLSDIPTENKQAHKLFIEAQNNLGLRQFDSLVSARKQYEEAIELDPEYAEAHAALAETIMVLYTNHQAIDTTEAWELAGASVANALRLDPENAEAYAVRGMIAADRWRQTRIGAGNIRAADDFRKALDLNSNLANAYIWFSTLRDNENDVDGAIEMLTQALLKDPRSRIPFVNLSALFALQGRNEAATEALLKAIEIFPGWEVPLRYMSEHLQRLGRLDEAIAWSVEQTRISDDPLAGANAIGILRLFGDEDALAAFMNGIPDDHPLTSVGVGLQKFVNGDYSGTLDALGDTDAERLGALNLVYPLMVRAAILLEDYEQARDLLIKSSPQLVTDQDDSINRFNLRAAVMLAFVEQKRGNLKTANSLLERALGVASTLPRVGYSGHGIRDVQILTMQGRIPAALDKPRDAIDEGFVSEMPFDFWGIETDPLIAPLRGDSRFIEMREELQARIETMRLNVEVARDSNDWSELRSLAASSLSANTGHEQ